jgi:hypothetical protein
MWPQYSMKWWKETVSPSRRSPIRLPSVSGGGKGSPAFLQSLLRFGDVHTIIQDLRVLDAHVSTRYSEKPIILETSVTTDEAMVRRQRQ